MNDGKIRGIIGLSAITKGSNVNRQTITVWGSNDGISKGEAVAYNDGNNEAKVVQTGKFKYKHYIAEGSGVYGNCVVSLTLILDKKDR